MHALEYEGELLPSERPTIPVPAPRESGVRLKVSQIAWPAATIDVVVCDLSRDPRSEDYLARTSPAEAVSPESPARAAWRVLLPPVKAVPHEGPCAVRSRASSG
jgi:hypothetical protein